MIEIDDLITDPEFTNQLPPMDPEAFNKLESSILGTGAVINPIVTWQGIIVDGHKRCDIIRKHKDQDLRYDIYEMDFPDRAAALAWMYESQLGQRNLTSYQKSYLLGKQYEAEKQSQGGTGANRFTKKVQTGQNDQSVKEDNLTTAQRIAKEYGIGEKTVRRAESFARGLDLAEKTVPGTRQEILAGRIRPLFQEIEELTEIEDPEERKMRIEGFHLDKKNREEGSDDDPEEDIGDPITEVSIDEVKRISAGMESSDGQADEDGVIEELEDALETLIFRWEKCVEMNWRAARGDSYYRRRDELIKKGQEFFHNFKRRKKKK